MCNHDLMRAAEADCSHLPDFAIFAICSLAEVGEVMSRPLVGMEEEASQLERLCFACRAAVLDDDSDVESRC